MIYFFRILDSHFVVFLKMYRKMNMRCSARSMMTLLLPPWKTQEFYVQLVEANSYDFQPCLQVIYKDLQTIDRSLDTFQCQTYPKIISVLTSDDETLEYLKNLTTSLRFWRMAIELTSKRFQTIIYRKCFTDLRSEHRTWVCCVQTKRETILQVNSFLLKAGCTHH